MVNISKKHSEYDAVDLGCGRDKVADALGVDINPATDADVIHDLNETPWPLPDDQYTEIYCRDILEHVERPLEFLEEVYRIGKTGGRVYIRVPHFTSNDAWVDPTHHRGFSVLTFFDYTHPDGHFSYYTDAEFAVVDWHLGFPPGRVQPWNVVVRAIANRWPELYETTVLRSLSPAKNLSVILDIR